MLAVKAHMEADRRFEDEIRFNEKRQKPYQKELFSDFTKTEVEIDIIPGIRIGRFKLGAPDDHTKDFLGTNCKKESNTTGIIFKSPSMWFWQNKLSNEIIQICVMNNFKGKYLGRIGIGSTLKEILILRYLHWKKIMKVVIVLIAVH